MLLGCRATLDLLADVLRIVLLLAEIATGLIFSFVYDGNYGLITPR